MSFFIISPLSFIKATTENQTGICFNKKSLKKSNFFKPFLPVSTNLLYKVDDETPCTRDLAYAANVVERNLSCIIQSF